MPGSPAPAAPASIAAAPEPPQARIVNVVCTFSISERVDLRNLTSKLPWAEFNAKKFAAASIRLRSPRSTCLCFSSGNLVVTGTVSENDALLASRRYAAILRRYVNPRVRMQRFRIQNIVATCECNCCVDLQQVHAHWQTHCSYEPEVFPGLIMRLEKVVVLIFRSGKVVLTGAKERAHVREALKAVYEGIVRPYRAQHNHVSNSADYRVEQLHMNAVQRGQLML
tara:strand:+ start:451 stop:1125 length:675 start_codon:yes stop_codon:yes gene_type:complete